MQIESPFIQEIPECKLLMRKLRKKIYKHMSGSRPSKPTHEQSQDILNILKSRNLPNFVIDPLKKKRTFDFAYLSNVMISGQATPQQIACMTSNQENQIQALFAEHKQRMRKHVQKVQELNFDKKWFESSSEICLEQRSHDKSQNYEEYFQQRNQNKITCLEGDGAIGNIYSFLSLGRDPESELDWLHF